MANTLIIQGNQNTTKLINLLKQATKQYSALNKDQEILLIKENKHDREHLNKLLFMHNIKLVFNIAKHYKSKTKDFDGLVQEGMKGLAEAASRFDIEKGTKFTTYAHFWIKKYILQIFDEKKTYIEQHGTSLNAPVALLQTSDTAGTTLENFINEFIEPTQALPKSILSELSSHEQVNICKYLIENLENDNSLSSTDKDIFIDYFYNKQKTRDIALKYGVEIPYVFQIRNNVLDKFKTILKDLFQITLYDEVAC